MSLLWMGVQPAEYTLRWHESSVKCMFNRYVNLRDEYILLISERAQAWVAENHCIAEQSFPELLGGSYIHEVGCFHPL